MARTSSVTRRTGANGGRGVRPFLGSTRTVLVSRRRMGMPRATCFPALAEVPDFEFESFLLVREIPLVSDYEFF